MLKAARAEWFKACRPANTRVCPPTHTSAMADWRWLANTWADNMASAVGRPCSKGCSASSTTRSACWPTARPATARPLARLLKVAEPAPSGFLIVGANGPARAVAIDTSGRTLVAGEFTLFNGTARVGRKGDERTLLRFTLSELGAVSDLNTEPYSLVERMGSK